MNNHEKLFYHYDPDKELEAAVGLIKFKRGPQRAYFSSEKIKKTPFQIKVLSELFKLTPFPSTATRKDLSLLLCIPQRSIQVWFQNTRQARKRMKNSEPDKHNLSISSQTDTEDVSLRTLVDIINYVKHTMH